MRSKRQMGIADKTLFVLGIILGGVVAFVLVAGVVVALIKLYLDSKEETVQLHSGPQLDDPPETERIAGTANLASEPSCEGEPLRERPD